MRRRTGDPEELLDQALFRSDRRSHDARFQCLRSRQRREAWGNHHFLPFFSQCLSFSASISYNRLISINLVYRLACLVCSRCCVVYEWLIKFSWQMIFPRERDSFDWFCKVEFYPWVHIISYPWVRIRSNLRVSPVESWEGQPIG